MPEFVPPRGMVIRALAWPFLVMGAALAVMLSLRRTPGDGGCLALLVLGSLGTPVLAGYFASRLPPGWDDLERYTTAILIAAAVTAVEVFVALLVLMVGLVRTDLIGP